MSQDHQPGYPGPAPVNVLLLASDEVDSARLLGLLSHPDLAPFSLRHCHDLPTALETLDLGTTDMVLVGRLNVDDHRSTLFDKLRRRAANALILPVTSQSLAEAEMEPPQAQWLPSIVRYIGRRKTTEAALRAADDGLFEEKQRAQVTLNAISDAVVITNPDCHVTYLNPQAEELTGWRLHDAMGQELDAVFHVVDAETRLGARNPARRAMCEDRTVDLASDGILIRRDGTESAIEDSAAPIHDREGRVTGAVIIFRDLHQSREMTRRMAHLATHDSLTGLPNRVFLYDQINQAIRLSQRHGQRVGLLYLDLDNFKQINDTLGHVIGDRVLKRVAKRIRTIIRASDTVCRQGGDEFVILLAEIDTPSDATEIAAKISKRFRAPLLIDGHAINVQMSIGISVNPDDADSPEDLIAHADRAMYAVKQQRKPAPTTLIAQAPGERQVDTEASAVERDLHRALDHQEFVLHYQPQVDLLSGRVRSVEALLRWASPDRGLVSPTQFVPIAEQNGLIIPIGRWVLEAACNQCSAWVEAGISAPRLCVNVSATEVTQTGFPEGVARILSEAGMDPGQLELELTETALLQDVRQTELALKALSEMGVNLAIDDFGSSYASVKHLGRFPVNTLKIDRSFLQDLSSASHGEVVLGALIKIGHSLGYQVLAEGIETDEALNFIKDNACDLGQGFLLGSPGCAEETARLLVSRR